MSLSNGQNVVVAAALDNHQLQTTGNPNTSWPHQNLPPMSPNSNMTLSHSNGSQFPVPSTHQEEVASPSTPRTPGPREKESRYQHQGGHPDSPAIEESTEARLERLGRQRPEVFDSIWAEIAFIFSISMSQVLTV